MKRFSQLPLASLAMFTLGTVVSHEFSPRYLASIVVVFLAVTLLWAVGKRFSFQ